MLFVVIFLVKKTLIFNCNDFKMFSSYFLLMNEVPIISK